MTPHSSGHCCARAIRIVLFTLLVVVVAGRAFAQGSISGTVTSSTTLLGLPGTVIQLYDFNSTTGIPAFTTVTDGSGHYTVNLPASTYGVATQNIAGYINEVFGGVQCSAVCVLDTITPVVVTNTAITGIDFVLDPGGRIAGTITDSGTGLPIAGVAVFFFGSVGDEFPFTIAISDVNGNYLSDGGSVTGNVFAVTANTLGYQNEAYDNVKCLTCDLTSVGTPIAVTLGVTTTGRNFALDPGGTISGTVRDSFLNPVAHVEINVTDANGNVVEMADTDGSGHYTTGGLPAGSYYVQTDTESSLVDQVYDGVSCPNRWCEVTLGTAIAVTVPSATTGIDFVLPTGGTITGTVTNASGGAPLVDVFVSFFDPAGFFVAGANTNGPGGYSTHALLPGTYFAAIFSPAGFLQQLYNNLPCTPGCTSANGTPITVAAGTSTANVNFALLPSGPKGSISGTVTNTSTNSPVVGVSVQLWSATGALLTSVDTNGSGVYTFSNLNLGPYYVKTASFTGLINQIYNGAFCSLCDVTASGGTLISVTAGNTFTADFALTPGGQISGTVINANGGAPISGLQVLVHSAAGVVVASGFTSGAGVYTTVGLPDGTYYLRTNNTLGFVNKLYNNVTCPLTGCNPTSGTPVVVAGPATVGGKNFSLDLGGKISGGVRTADGLTAIGFQTVQVFNAQGFLLGTASTDGSGNYLTQSLPAGSYFLRTSNSAGFLDEVYDNVACVPFCTVVTGTPVVVTAGATTAGRNFGLSAGGAVTGKVTDVGTTNPLANVNVGLYTPGGVFAKGASTNATGIYSVSGVPPGTYYARTSVQGGQNYLDELWNDMPCAPACTVSAGAPIAVHNGVSVNGTDFALSAGGGAISGTVTDAGTSGVLSGVQVQVYTSGGTLAKFAGTNTSGVYTLSGLPAGAYYVRTNIINGLNYLDELYNNKPCFPTCTVTTGDAVTVFNGATTGGIDFALDANLVQNSRFDSGTLLWKTFAAPDNAHMVSSVVNGVFNWHRIIQDPGTPVSQATIFFETGRSFAAGEPLLARFDLANTAATLKVARVLLVADPGFSDFDACTFALPPDGVMRTYTMKGRTTAAWTNATIYFYATTPFTVGEAGNFQVDNVSLRPAPGGQSVTKTECIDPLTPGPGIGAPGGNMLTNGDFASGALAPGWGTFGTITVRTPMVGNVAEFIRPANTHPPGVLLQPMTPDIPANTLMTLTLQLGNSSGVRKRALVLVHDNDFSSFVACAWWMAPGQGLGTYTMIFRNSELWTDPTVAIYPSTIGPDTWFRLDNVSLQLTPAASTAGTECVDPGGSRPAIDGLDLELAAALSAPALVTRSAERTPGADAATGASAVDGGTWTETADGWAAIGMSAEPSILRRTEPVDLRGATAARLTFESWLSSLGSQADVEVSVDGVNWITLAHVVPSDTWQPTTVDLGAFLNEVVSLRFVLHGAEPADAATPDVWRVRDVDVEIRTSTRETG